MISRCMDGCWRWERRVEGVGGKFVREDIFARRIWVVVVLIGMQGGGNDPKKRRRPVIE